MVRRGQYRLLVLIDRLPALARPPTSAVALFFVGHPTEGGGSALGRFQFACDGSVLLTMAPTVNLNNQS
jgi:hypothetical protein